MIRQEISPSLAARLLCDANDAYCHACGDWSTGEPDLHNAECPSCGAAALCGGEISLKIGYLVLSSETPAMHPHDIERQFQRAILPGRGAAVVTTDEMLEVIVCPDCLADMAERGSLAPGKLHSLHALRHGHAMRYDCGCEED